MYKEWHYQEQSTADELAIQNMLTALEYSEKNELLNDDEKKYVKNAIKAHVLWNAHIVLRHLNKFDDELLDKEETNDTIYVR